MLAHAKEYYERHAKRTPLLYQEVPIRYEVTLNPDGTLRDPVPIDRASGVKGNLDERGKREAAPNLVRSSGDAPQLFADGSDYTFGIDPSVNAEKAAERHRLYLEMVEECARETEEPSVIAVRDFLRAGRRPHFNEGYDYAAEVTFAVDGVRPIELASVQRFWEQTYRRKKLADAPEIPCVVCGVIGPVVDGYPGRVKGVLGGQSAGTFIVSANAPPFLSYGLQGSQIAPTCLECADAAVKGVNALIAGKETHVYLGGTTYIFWTRESDEVPFYLLTTEPTPETVQDLLTSVRTGRLPAGVREDRFYAAALTGSSARTVVREWIDTTVGNAATHLATWFQRQRIADWDGADGAPFSIRSLAGGTVPLRRAGPDWDRLPPSISRALLRSAFTPAPLPSDVLHRTIQRIRAERGVRRVHAALVKLVVLSQSASEETATVSLNPDHPDVAYHCGRLLAVLEEAQRAAQPRVTNTIVDRFFGTASSAPATVFGRLLRGAQPHLSALETSNHAAYTAIQRKLEQVNDRIDAFPATLTLRQQGLFALGYYHQRAFRPTQANRTPDQT